MTRTLTALLLAALPLHGQSFTVATVGDSFADSLYNAMRSRSDLVHQSPMRLLRWSRPIVGLTRTDFFDYLQFLRESPDLGTADLCFVQIGSNDMQSIPLGPQQWIFYGSPEWKQAYAARTLEMALLLTDRRCGQVFWVLQPGFEKRDGLACHRELINEVQRSVLHLDRTRVLEVATTEASYGPDQTHFSRAYLLQLSPAMFQLVDTARQVAHMRCLACHRNVETSPPAARIFPLEWWRGPMPAPVWMPDRIGAQCRTPAVRRARLRVQTRIRKHRA